METREKLFRILDVLSTYHPDLAPDDADTMEDLTEKFIFWATEYNDGRLSYINFKWDMTAKEYSDILDPAPLHDDGTYVYEGAVFFGDLKLEIIRGYYGMYCNLFWYGAETEPGSAYDYLEDGTPYEELIEEAEQITPDARRGESFTVYAEGIENQILRLLKDHPELIPAAVGKTDPDKWYPGDTPYKISDITRDV